MKTLVHSAIEFYQPGPRRLFVVGGKTEIISEAKIKAIWPMYLSGSDQVPHPSMNVVIEFDDGTRDTFVGIPYRLISHYQDES